MDEKKQRAFDERYLRMARIWSENSYAIRRQVGCLIVKERMIISDGYNGTPSGFENICEYPTCMRDGGCNRVDGEGVDCLHCPDAKLTTQPYVLHAEANAISKLAKSHNSAEGATLYTTDEPCLQCSKLIIQSGIRRVVFQREYHDHDGVELLKRAGIEVEQIIPNI